MNKFAYIISAHRSAVIPKNGAFSQLHIHELASPVIQKVLKSANISKNSVTELIMSNAVGAGGNPARLAALAANLPERVGGLTIDRQCAGGLDAIWLAAQMIMSGIHDVIIAGGSESASRRPIRLAINPNGGEPKTYIRPNFTGLKGRDPDMVVSAAKIANSENITRNAQEEWAIKSHQKALVTDFNEEIVPIQKQKIDSFTRNLTKKTCARAAILEGSITSATTAVDSDAAAFCLIVSEKIARNYPNAFRIQIGSSCASTPDEPVKATLEAMNHVLDVTKINPNSLKVIEIMEAYSAQAIIAATAHNFNISKINIGGGALARGHPIGASGAILAVRLFHELKKTGGAGLATIAAAGGLGSALILTNLHS